MLGVCGTSPSLPGWPILSIMVWMVNAQTKEVRHDKTVQKYSRNSCTSFNVTVVTLELACQMVVEKMLEQQGSSRRAIGREAFTQQVWEWKKQYGGFISQQLRSLGASCDWSRERFTLDAQLSGMAFIFGSLCSKRDTPLSGMVFCVQLLLDMRIFNASTIRL